MKVILISEALDEPYEMDSADFAKESDPVWAFQRAVEQQVEALVRAEKMRADPKGSKLRRILGKGA